MQKIFSNSPFLTASINRRVASKNNGNKENYKTSQPEDSNCLESSSNNPHCKNDEPLSENNQEYDKLNNTDQNFDHYLQESKDNEEDESDEQVDGNFSEPYQNLIKNAYLVHSQYLSGITEKSDEESHITNKMYQNS